MSGARRLATLTEAGLLHARPEAVRAALFTGGGDFFLPADKVQVKYEMLRAHLVDDQPVTAAAAAHGYSRAAFYLVLASFSESGMSGLLDEARGRKGPVKLRPEIVSFIRESEADTGALVEQVAEEYGVRLHRRTIERARLR
ncbi:helix-turn-helix domain-containing protein [Nocardioides sp. AN3]